MQKYLFSIFSILILTFSTQAFAKKGAISPQVLVDFHPKKVIVDVEPGKTVLVELMTENKKKIPMKAIVVLKEFHFNENGSFNYDKIKAGKKGDYSLIPYASVAESSFMLKPLERKKKIIKLKIPKDLKGSRGLLMSVQVDPIYKKTLMKRETKAGISFSVNYTGPLIVHVKDSSKINIISKNMVNYKKRNKQLKINSIIEYKSEYFSQNLLANYILLDKNNKKILSGELTNVAKRKIIYPDNKRKFSGGSITNLKKGEYKVVITFFDSKFNFTKTYQEKLVIK